MPAIAQQRCFVHDFREAVARCPVCRNSYCRECVTEHEGRVVCASCLSRTAITQRTSRRTFARTIAFAYPLIGLFIAWIIFYGVGRMLMLIPAPVHDGTVWEK